MANIYLVERVDLVGYDAYDSLVAVAVRPLDARITHPDEYTFLGKSGWERTCSDGTTYSREHDNEWVKSEDVSKLKVTHIGRATDHPLGVVLASFNAG